ncbi:MAG: PQQ-binding-like beta-propeller repeat protein [Bryobacterales bacterium]|nr:PQQ-binding-like beta-propeller repeat protein [Bryobacterales bacterium]
MLRRIWLLPVSALALFASDPDEDLLSAARKGDLAAVKSLLQNGAPIETKTSYGQTPLYLAAMNGHEDVARFLLDQGAKTDIRDTFYKAAMLDFVLMRKHTGVARLLIAKSSAGVDQLLDQVSGSGNAELVQAVLDKNSGKILWERTAHSGVPKTKRHPKSSQASPTPVTNGKIVIAWFGSEGLYAYSASGDLLWKKDLGLQNAGWFFDPDSEWGAASSPVIYKNSVILQCDRHKEGFIAAFDLESGNEIWRAGRAELPTWGTPTIVHGRDRVEVVTNGSKAIRGYDADTGKELWNLGPNSEVTCTTPVSSGGLIYVTAGYPPVQPIYAIKAGSSGDLTLKGGKDSSDSIAWSKQRGGVYLPSPLVHDGILYTVNNNGILSAYDAKTGDRIYQQRIEGGNSFVASPVLAAGKLYIAGEEGDVFVIKAGRQFELLSRNPLGESVLATPALSGNIIFIRGESHLFAIAEHPQ